MAIRVLPREVSELIAAGEVIERPASIVKELVENAIDAGASHITVEVKDGGIRYLRVTDDGCGIEAEQMPTAFLRHATSKLTDAEDLSHIATLGFRGEALASIAAVSRVEMCSKTADAVYGSRLLLAGGIVESQEETGCPDGTTVIVRDLFYNTPARLKFLKRAVSEANTVAGVVDHLALSHPEIAFRLIRDNREERRTSGDGELLHAISGVCGRRFAVTLFPVSYEMHGMQLSGYACYPVHGRANRSMQHFFINGRYVRSRTCGIALEEGYHAAMMTGKFPSCVLFLTMPFDQVDVNVHPAKTEVRFTSERQVFELICFGLRSALLRENELPDPEKPAEKTPEGEQLSLPSHPRIKREEPFAVPTGSQPLVLHASTPEDLPKPQVTEENGYHYLTAEVLQKASRPRPEPEPELEPDHPKPRILGELFATYVVAEYGDQVIVMDKHAAHERILYNQLVSSHEPLERQVLLVPLTVLLSPEEAGALLQAKERLLSLGFALAKDKDGVSVREVPAILDRQDIPALLEEIAENLLLQKEDISPQALEDLYHSVACKAAVKAGHSHSEKELAALLWTVYHDRNVRYCPHGRPAIFVWSKRELDKKFGRIQ